jgi:hypothetical protein
VRAPLTKHEGSGETVVQVSGAAPDGSPILAVLAKRTYRFTPRRPLAVAEEQLAIRVAPVFDAVGADPTLMLADADTYPLKLLTDVVVRGHVYPERKTFSHAAVRVGDLVKAIVAQGDRRAYKTPGGRIAFSEAEPFEKIPLSYAHAYGGRDARAEAKNPWPLKGLAPHVDAKLLDVAAHSPYLYARNRHGRGYLFEATAEALDELVLPNLEDPDDMLTGERLVVPDVDAWHTMPLPAGTSWIPPSHFARGVFLGMFPNWKPLPLKLREIERGLLPPGVREIDVFAGHPLVLRLANGASLGLAVPHLAPGAAITLTRLHEAEETVTITLPEKAPNISVDGRGGKLLTTTPALHTVEIEPDLGRVSLVWRGAAPALRPYLHDELVKMPLLVEWRDR